MKIRISSLILLLYYCFCSSVSAQIQQGIVKTKGRLGDNGSIVHGKRLQGATVIIKGRSAVVSGGNGTFSFAIPGQRFYLQNVKKQGYLLTDMDILSKQYSYSKENPLYIVMETPDTQMADKLTAERKIRRTLQKTLLQREDEIEQLKAENKISQQEYQQKLQELYSSQEKNEKLISDMAERYSKLDHDQVNGFNRRISELILNGELAKADSLINSKGDIHARKAALQHHQDVNAEEEKELAQRQENLSKSRAYTQKELEDLAQDCYHKYEIFKMDFQNDSAAYYLEFRAELDSMNVKWQLETGIFLQNYLAAYECAQSYYQRALHNALQQFGENHPDVATSYNNIGSVYSSQGNYVKALEYGNKALNIQLCVLGEKHPDVATSYNNIGFVYYSQDDYAKALKHYKRALEIQLGILNENHPDVARSYNNMGLVFQSQGDYAKALEYHKKALEIRMGILGKKHPSVARSYNNIGLVCQSQGDYVKALEYHNKALGIQLVALGENHSEVASSYNNIGFIYYSQGIYAKALEYYNKALAIKSAIMGENHPDVAWIYMNIGGSYESQGKYIHSLEFYTKALSIWKRNFDESHSNVNFSIMLIYMAYIKLFSSNIDYDKASYCSFLENVAFIATIVDGDTPASQQGMGGEYYLLEFADWNQDDIKCSLFDKNEELRGKPKNILVMKDGVISQHHFEDKIGAQLSLKCVGKDKKSRITEAYHKWKEQNK